MWKGFFLRLQIFEWSSQSPRTQPLTVNSEPSLVPWPQLHFCSLCHILQSPSYIQVKSNHSVTSLDCWCWHRLASASKRHELQPHRLIRSKIETRVSLTISKLQNFELDLNHHVSRPAGGSFVVVVVVFNNNNKIIFFCLLFSPQIWNLSVLHFSSLRRSANRKKPRGTLCGSARLLTVHCIKNRGTLLQKSGWTWKSVAPMSNNRDTSGNMIWFDWSVAVVLVERHFAGRGQWTLPHWILWICRLALRMTLRETTRRETLELCFCFCCVFFSCWQRIRAFVSYCFPMSFVRLLQRYDCSSNKRATSVWEYVRVLKTVFIPVQSTAEFSISHSFNCQGNLKNKFTQRKRVNLERVRLIVYFQ